MSAYDQNLAVASTLPFRWHWLVGSILVFVGMVIENPSAITQDWQAVAIGVCAFGLLTGIISKIILVKVFPAPFAALVNRLELGSRAA